MTSILKLPLTLRRLYLQRSEVEQLVLASTAFSVLLLFARVWRTGQSFYIFLAWNLFLAVIPYWISKFISTRLSIMESPWKLTIALIAWILFIPNSFYIVTDLFHLGQNYVVPAWFDLLLIFSFAWNGLLLGLLSVRQIEKILAPRLLFKREYLFVVPVMVLNALGVYIGRYLRYNSWDIITNPFRLVVDIAHIISHPIVNKNAWGMTFLFSTFLVLMYSTIRKISRSIW
jgi:uncharacterized membrane protein